MNTPLLLKALSSKRKLDLVLVACAERNDPATIGQEKTEELTQKMIGFHHHIAGFIKEKQINSDELIMILQFFLEQLAGSIFDDSVEKNFQSTEKE